MLHLLSAPHDFPCFTILDLSTCEISAGHKLHIASPIVPRLQPVVAPLWSGTCLKM